ncbi:MAG: HU family DNA-binding protein [Planctomycetota bacterium]|jgi:nucleoid DNA-binding protein
MFFKLGVFSSPALIAGTVRMATISKQDLIDRLADETGLSKARVKVVFASLLSHISEELAKGNRLEFRDFGVFDTKQVAGRPAQNPRTGEKFYVPAHNVVRFRPSRKLRTMVTEDGKGTPTVHVRPISENNTPSADDS